MKNKKLLTLSLVTIISAVSSVSAPAASSCTQDDQSLEILRSSWIDEDLAFLDGRKEIGYVFEKNVLNYSIYQKGSLLGVVRSDPFYQEEKASILVWADNFQVSVPICRIQFGKDLH